MHRFLYILLARLIFLGAAFGLPWSAAGAQLASFPAGSGGWQLGTLAIGKIDSNPLPAIIVPYRDTLLGLWHLDAFRWDGTHVAGFPYDAGLDVMNVSPTLYDLDGDGKMEIIFTRANSVIALNGNGSVRWSNQVSSLNYVPQAGYQAVTNGFYMTPLGVFQSTLPPSAVFSSEVSPPIIADFSGTGAKEIVTAWKIDPDSLTDNQDYNPFINDIFGLGEWGTVGEVWSGGVLFFDAATGARNFVYHIHQLVESGLAVGRPTTNQAQNIYVLNDSDSVVSFDRSKPYGFWGADMLHGMFGKNLKMMSGSYQQGVDVYTADLDGDGLDEVFCPTTQWNPLWQPHESLLDDDGALLWRKWKDTVTIDNQNGWLNSAGMIPCNPDHDNRLDIFTFTHSYEIAFRTWNGVEFVDRAGWPKIFYPFLPTPPVVGDVDGDGQEEVIIGTYDPAQNPSSGSLYIFALDGTLKQSIAVPGGLKHIPALADVNGDGKLDVIYRSLSGVIYVQNFGATNTNLVSWATHRGNFQRDGNRGKSLFPAGTPLVVKKESGCGRTSFQWKPTTNGAQLYRIFRAESGAGPFQQIASMTTNVTTFTDSNLRTGWQYFYEVAAVFGGSNVFSAPFALTPLLNSNLVVNGAMEENDNSHWDKFNTGDIAWTNMIASTNAFQGRQSMQIILQNQPTTDSINQYAMYGTPRAYLPVSNGVLYSYGGFIKSEGLDQPTQQWFEWTSSLTGENPNARPTFPYPDYFTPILVPGTSATPWTYLNRVFSMPVGFPNVELRHRFSSDHNFGVNGSLLLDNLFFRALPSPADARWTNLISFGSPWRYLDRAPPSNWFAENFDDSTWTLAPAKFGAGDTPTNIATILPQRKSAYYFRRKFLVPSGNFEELLLAATCTDDYGGTIYPLQLWINGQEILTSGIEAVSNTGNETKFFDLTPFVARLRPGTNTIAVILNNSFQSDWDDVAFDINLKAIAAQNVLAQIKTVRKNAASADITVISPPGAIFRLESSDTLPAAWQLVQVATNVAGGTLTISDTGQNGRTPPPNAPRRYYRAAPF